MTKATLIKQANAYGVTANYSGGTTTMFISGNDEKVKSFIRVINLKGKGARKFNLAQAN